jgi:hypothetical protein
LLHLNLTIAGIKSGNQAYQLEKLAEATGKDTKGIFQFNAGMERKTFPDYNPYTIKRCRDCDIAKGKINLARTDNELCEACKLLRQYKKGVSKKLESYTIGTTLYTATRWCY